jgi:ACS family hexuronate transporter-like MFS transporter
MATVIATRIGGVRWVVVALLFFGTTINYVDRAVLGLLEPTLAGITGWTKSQYGDVNAAFTVAYAVGMLAAGYMFDRLGTRKGYALVLSLWSLAAMAHALARTVFGFATARFALGLSEAGNFPGAIKAVAEWFPKKERALATGIFNAGTNVGPTVAPLIVAAIALNMGWQWAFVITGASGFVFLILWLALFRRPEEHPRVSPAELAHIRSDPPDPAARVPWIRLIPHRQTWAFMLGKFLTDPIWWFYLFWLAPILHDRFGLDLKTYGPPLIAVYLFADVGSIGGGWLSSAMMKRGSSLNVARKTAMLLCALAVVPITFVTQVDGVWMAVGLVGLAAAAHQGFSCNLFTLVSDTFPRQAVGSVVGMGGMAGAIGGTLFQMLVGRVVDLSGGSYLIPFAIAGSAYCVGLLVIHALAPRLDPVRLD